MPLVAALIGALEWAAGSLVARVLLALGMSFISYQGVDYLLDETKAQMLASFGSLGGVGLQFMGVLQVGTCINIIASALTMRATLAGLSGGTLTKLITKS